MESEKQSPEGSEGVPEIVNAELVNLPPKALKVRGRIFMPRLVQPITPGQPIVAHNFSQREYAFLSVFLNTFNLDLACREIGITTETGRNYLKRGKIRRYLDEKIQEKAISAGTTIDNLVSWLRKVRDGAEVPSGMQMEAAKEIRKMIQPVGAPGIQVNIQNNNVNPAAPSPFSDMSAEDLAKAIQSRGPILDAIMQDRENGLQGSNPRTD